MAKDTDNKHVYDEGNEECDGSFDEKIKICFPNLFWIFSVYISTLKVISLNLIRVSVKIVLLFGFSKTSKNFSLFMSF